MSMKVLNDGESDDDTIATPSDVVLKPNSSSNDDLAEYPLSVSSNNPPRDFEGPQRNTKLSRAERHKSMTKSKRQSKRLAQKNTATPSRHDRQTSLKNLEKVTVTPLDHDHEKSQRSQQAYVGTNVTTRCMGTLEGLLKDGYTLVRYER